MHWNSMCVAPLPNGFQQMDEESNQWYIFSGQSIHSVHCLPKLRGPKSAADVNRFPPTLLPEKSQVASNGAKGFQLHDERMQKCNVVITNSNKINHEIGLISERIEPLSLQIIQHKVYAVISCFLLSL